MKEKKMLSLQILAKKTNNEIESSRITDRGKSLEISMRNQKSLTPKSKIPLKNVESKR